MPDRFCQIVITKRDDGRYHITLQDELEVVKSFDLGERLAYQVVLESMGKIKAPEPDRRFVKTA